MRNAAQLAQEVLDLPPDERERLALLAWESLEGDAAFNPDDPQGDEAALQRDREIESGKVKAVGHDEFVRATGGTSG